MAITFQITDGTDTVDMNDGTNIRLGAAFQMNIGTGAVTEQVIAGWSNSLTADSKAAISKKFNRLIQKAILHYQEQRIDRAVWLVWKPDDQTDTQYAKVMGGGEVEVVKHTIGGYGGGYFNPTIVREGAWRDTAPNGTAGTQIASFTAHNRVTASPLRENWGDIANTRTNDMPSLLQIQLGPGGTGYTKTIIGMKRGIEANLDNFNPHFNPDDQTSAQTEVTPSSLAPNNVHITMTADGSVTWTIDNTVLVDYIGNYQVYAITYQSAGAGSATARFIVGSDVLVGNYVPVGTTLATNFLYLGNFSLPGHAYNPFKDYGSTLTDLTISLDFDITGTATCIVYGLVLIPSDIPPMSVTFAAGTSANDLIEIDGINELALHLNSAEDMYVEEVTIEGRYPQSIGGTVNRFYVYTTGTSGYDHTMVSTVTIEAVERFLGLRGNT